VSARRAAAAGALGAAALALVAAPAASGASRTLTVEGWWPRTMAFSDRALVWTEAAPVRVDPRRIPGAMPAMLVRIETTVSAVPAKRRPARSTRVRNASAR